MLIACCSEQKRMEAASGGIEMELLDMKEIVT